MAKRTHVKSEGEDENANLNSPHVFVFAFRPYLGFFELLSFSLPSQTLAYWLRRKKRKTRKIQDRAETQKKKGMGAENPYLKFVKEFYLFET